MDACTSHVHTCAPLIVTPPQEAKLGGLVREFELPSRLESSFTIKIPGKEWQVTLRSCMVYAKAMGLKLPSGRDIITEGGFLQFLINVSSTHRSACAHTHWCSIAFHAAMHTLLSSAQLRGCNP